MFPGNGNPLNSTPCRFPSRRFLTPAPQGILHCVMVWPNYRFLDLSEAEKHLRRENLHNFALFAQLSALVPAAAVLLYRLAKWVASSRGSPSGGYAAVASSPVLKARRHSSRGTWASQLRRARWWLSEDVVAFGTVLGQRDRNCVLYSALMAYALTREQNGLSDSCGCRGFCCSVCCKQEKVCAV